MATRREILVKGFAAAAFVSSPVSLVGVASAIAPSCKVLKPTTDITARDQQSSASLTLVSSQNASYKSLLQQHFPSLVGNKQYKILHSNAALLVNNDTRPIYGYRVSWCNQLSSGESELYSRRFVNHPTVQLKARQITGQVPMLGVGDVALVTPLFSWRKTDYESKPSMKKFSGRKFRHYQKNNPRAFGFATRNQNVGQIAISLDAVAFANEVTGPKRRSLSKSIRISHNAEHDQALAIHKAMLKNASPDKTLALESSLFAGTIGPVAVASSVSPLYEKARKRFAKKLGFLCNVDPRLAESVVLQVRSIKKSNIG